MCLSLLTFWRYMMDNAGIQRDPTLLIFQGARMLILTRRVGETLMIGDEVTVTVLGVKGNQYVLA